MEDRFRSRIWDRWDNEMIQGNCNIIFDCSGGMWWEFAGEINQQGLNKERFIRMQCTGLKDKNDKLIFEGDIVNWLSKEVSEGKQIYPERIFVVQPDIEKLYRLNNIINNYNTFPEVVGNIYENEELLK